MQSPITAATNYVIDQFLGTGTRDWSAELLKRTKANEQSDNRILSRKEKRVAGTNPSLPLDKYTGTYRSDIHGDIHISLVDGKLRMDFEHSSYLSATLSHWHYDVWEIVWDNKHAWFNFGTVKFNTDNNLNVLGMDFDVPNDDIFFEELKPYKVKSAGKK
jgi:hypothetical protein